MIQPGRESAASLEVATVVALPERPDPPSNLTEGEATEWRNVVATKPADWFMRDSQPVLAAYCQAIVRHRFLMDKWHEGAAATIKEMKDLSGMINTTANLLAQLATKLRLTQQSRYTPGSANTASKKSSGSKLWQKP
jgi:hypothetical protein